MPLHFAGVGSCKLVMRFSSTDDVAIIVGYITFWLDYNSNMAVQLLLCCGSFKQGIGYSHKGTVHGGMFFVGGKCMLVHVKNCVTQIKHSAWPFKNFEFLHLFEVGSKVFYLTRQPWSRSSSNPS